MLCEQLIDVAPEDAHRPGCELVLLALEEEYMFWGCAHEQGLAAAGICLCLVCFGPGKSLT